MICVIPERIIEANMETLFGKCVKSVLRVDRSEKSAVLEESILMNYFPPPKPPPP